LQAATDPAFPNKWPVSPLPRIPTNLEENILRNYLEKLQLASAKYFFKQNAFRGVSCPYICRSTEKSRIQSETIQSEH